MKPVIMISCCLLAIVPPAFAADSLPDKLHIEYRVTTGGANIGTNIRTLERQADGTYTHSLRTRPEGMARMFTRVEWVEEGRLRIRDGRVEPLSYTKYRVGSKNPRRKTVTFDRDNDKLIFSDGRSEPLPSGIMDEASIAYAFMLQPPSKAATGQLLLTNGKRVAAYDYRMLRDEALSTKIGEVETRVVEWRTKGNDGGGDNEEKFTAWLAPAQGWLPVKVVAVDGKYTATMTISLLETTGPVSASAPASQSSKE
jgi:hypothetical protein